MHTLVDIVGPAYFPSLGPKRAGSRMPVCDFYSLVNQQLSEHAAIDSVSCNLPATGHVPPTARRPCGSARRTAMHAGRRAECKKCTAASFAPPGGRPPPDGPKSHLQLQKAGGGGGCVEESVPRCGGTDLPSRARKPRHPPQGPHFSGTWNSGPPFCTPLTAPQDTGVHRQ